MSRTIEELTILRNSFSGGDTRKALDEAIASVEENEKVENKIIKICESNPTCKDSNGVPCPFYENLKGCYFRGKTPREWKKVKELLKGVENGL